MQCRRPASPRSACRRDQRGIIGSMALLLMAPVLLGLASLAVDGARLYMARNEMQNAADACALAAAYNNVKFTLGTNKGATVPPGTKTWAQLGQAVAQTITWQNYTDQLYADDADNALFESKTLTGSGTTGGNMTLRFCTSADCPSGDWKSASALSAGATNYNFVRCTIQRKNIRPWFMSLANTNKKVVTVKAEATAWTVTSSKHGNNCGLMPGSCHQAASLVR